MAIRKAGDRTGLRVKMCLYGRPDTGKTYAVTRLSNRFRTLILDCEGGSMSAPPEMPVGEFEDFEEINKIQEDYPSAILRVTSTEQLTNIWRELRKGNGRWEVIVIDTITEAQRLLVESIKKHDSTVQRDLGILTLQGWNALSEKFRSFARAFRDLPYHVVFTAHERYVGDDSTGIQRWVPLFEGSKTAFEFVGLMDVVGHAIKHERQANGELRTVREFRFVSTPTEEAKVRGGGLEVESADLCLIFDKLLQQNTTKTEQVQKERE